MDRSEIIYNPTAGEGEHTAQRVLAHFSAKGMEVSLRPTDDPNWPESLDGPLDSIIIAGGDGTVHKVAVELLERNQNHSLRVHPLGTANNISKVLEDIQRKRQLDSGELLPFDVGEIKGVEGDHFFIESMGFGLFPKFVKAIKSEDEKERIKRDKGELLKVFLGIIDGFEPKKTRIQMEGFKIKGNFLMVELLNINYLGPNLELSPEGNPNDGYFELCLVPANKKEEFKAFLTQTMLGGEDTMDRTDPILRLPCRAMTIRSKDTNFHVDDGILDHSGQKIKVKVLKGRLNFILS